MKNEVKNKVIGKTLEIVSDSSGQMSSTRIAIMVFTLCMAYEWISAVTLGEAPWNPNIQTVSFYFSLLGIKQVQQYTEAKAKKK